MASPASLKVNTVVQTMSSEKTPTKVGNVGSSNKPKHLSQPYNMHSISTESLPALFGAASLRRSNSNIIAKTRSSPPRGTSPSPFGNDHPNSYSTPSSPISRTVILESTPDSSQDSASATDTDSSVSSSPALPTSPGRLTSSATIDLTTSGSGLKKPLAGSSSPLSAASPRKFFTTPAKTATTTATARRPILVDMNPDSENFDFDDGDAYDPYNPQHDHRKHEENRARRRRPSSWDIMDMPAIDQLRQWMVCFCVVNFDLEKGQAIESIYPPSDFTPEETKTICFSSFPDSNTFDVGDTVFNFRIRSTTSGRAATGPTTDAGFLYGYVFFRQKQDPTIRRGFFQKSVVLISQHPFIGLFSKLVSALGPAYFEVGRPMLETAFHNIASWPAPVTDSLMELPFMGTLYEVQIAKPHQPQLLETAPFDIATYQPETHILSSIPMNGGGLYKHFQDLVPDLWLCWELMTLAEPVMLIGTSPEVCSEAVTSLVELINPIPYCGDYRPYFTVHSPEFHSFCNKSSPPSSLVLGVTNPFFIKTLEHWPHIIKIGKPINRRPNGRIAGHDGSKNSGAGMRGGKPSSLDFGLVSKRKGVIAKDTNLLCMLAEATTNRSSQGYLLDNILRKYFATLTEKFLVPLDRYFATLVPNDITLSTTTQFPHIAPFKQQTFLKFLSKNPPAIAFKAPAFKSNSEACQSFYKDFLKCGNFATWLRLRTIAAQNELRRRYVETLSAGDVERWVKGRSEVELVDLLVRLREELGNSADGSESTDGRVDGQVGSEVDLLDLFLAAPSSSRTKVANLSRMMAEDSQGELDESVMPPSVSIPSSASLSSLDFGDWSGDMAEAASNPPFHPQWTVNGQHRGGGASNAGSRNATPPPPSAASHISDMHGSSKGRPSPSTPIPSNHSSHHQHVHSTTPGPKAIPGTRPGLLFITEPDPHSGSAGPSSFGSNASARSVSSTARATLMTPSRSSSSSSLNNTSTGGWTEIKRKDLGPANGSGTGSGLGLSSLSSGTGGITTKASSARSRESSPERQRRRFAPEASVIRATGRQKERLRDQIRILIEALPVDLRESLQANEAKKRAAAASVATTGRTHV
ncbi:Protein dennd6a [Lunasporangiospora selenospora]|uniref:Protein dennd6a n=1 Tax=Lunasporangiospora selenospora TaxID=979761 RepID=A0A9P6KH55_9FUNG|nr:Protein dennd6a [Lunasporangiospora selenospora]